MKKYLAYNNKIQKINTKRKDIKIKSNIKLINDVDYVGFGNTLNGIFYVEEVRQLNHIIFSIKKVFNPNSKNNYFFSLVNIIEYQFGLEIPHTKNLVVEGPFYNLYPEAEFEGYGYWKQVNGKQETFVLMEHEEVLNSSLRTVYNYMKHIVKGHRFSSKHLKEIIRVFDVYAIDEIKNSNYQLLKIIKKPKRLAKLQNLFISNNEKEAAFKYLLEHNISSNIIVKILETYGKTSLLTIKKTPYELIKFKGINIDILDKIAFDEGKKYNDKDRIEAMISTYLNNKIIRYGDLYVELDEIVNEIDDEPSNINSVIKNRLFLNKVNNKETLEVINKMVSNNRLVLEESIDEVGKIYIYKRYHYNQEEFIVKKLKEIDSSISNNYVLDSEINKYLKSLTGFSLDVLQEEAVRMALQKRLSVLTGGPGTGKTQTIKVIVESLLKFNPVANIQLCAPTGRASKRMSEVIYMPAETIHKKLNYMPFESVDEQELEEIDCDLLIIDETSMIDVDLFFNLLDNITENTSVLLVGDYNQIPSVGPGLILRDIINSGVIPCVNLKKVFRQGKNSEIIDVSNEILDKNTNDIISNPSRGQFRYTCTNNDDETMNKIINSLNHSKINLKNPIKELQILTPMNDGLLGTLGLNKKLQDLFNPKDKRKEEVYVSPTKIFREGDKVIQTKNNYNLKVFNGSIGIVDKIDYTDLIVTVDFDGEYIDYNFDDLPDLNLAYAITVHKSQGSEFDYVIVPISSNHILVSNRNLIYTALTRAKKGIILIGPDLALIEAINKDEDYSKKSQIKQKLKR